MGIKTFRPYTPSQRHHVALDFAELTKSAPEKSLLEPLKKSGGRNNYGDTTTRFRGGGHKRRYRLIDFKRRKDNCAARVAAIEYDPNRTCFIALLHYEDGEKRYILAPNGLAVGTMVRSGALADPKPGNAMALRNIPQGLMVHTVELQIGKGGALGRSAGTFCQLQSKDGDYAAILLPSGELRRVHLDCRATIGEIGNKDHQNTKMGKAGRKRWLGRRPHNRGNSMNPHDHPLGGGEGHSNGGRHPCNRNGLLAKGVKTRQKRKVSNNHIIRRRKKGPHV
jgi:large subunit ribosomal protein L2